MHPGHEACPRAHSVRTAQGGGVGGGLPPTRTSQGSAGPAHRLRAVRLAFLELGHPGANHSTQEVFSLNPKMKQVCAGDTF